MSKIIRNYGWRPDVPCRDDFAYKAPTRKKLPDKVDNTSGFPNAPYDQGELGSCTSNAWAGLLEYTQKHENIADIMPSRLFIYYNERVLEHSVSSDSGASLRDGARTLSKQGYCPETDWPYQIAQYKVKPPQTCYTEAKTHAIITYQRIPRSLAQMQGCLAEGYCFVGGISVYENFESQQVADTGIVPMPVSGEQLLGGHAICFCGYDNTKQVFLARNSWGTDWGMICSGSRGYFSLPYVYLLDPDYSDDFWMLTLTS